LTFSHQHDIFIFELPFYSELVYTMYRSAKLLESKFSFNLKQNFLCSLVHQCFICNVSLKVLQLDFFPLEVLIHQSLTIVSVNLSLLHLPVTEAQLTLCRVLIL